MSNDRRIISPSNLNIYTYIFVREYHKEKIKSNENLKKLRVKIEKCWKLSLKNVFACEY